MEGISSFAAVQFEVNVILVQGALCVHLLLDCCKPEVFNDELHWGGRGRRDVSEGSRMREKEQVYAGTLKTTGS